MILSRAFLTLSLLAVLSGPLTAQDAGPPTPVLDSVAVEGNVRLTAQQIIGTAGLLIGQPTNYRDIQRALTALFRSGQFDDVAVRQGEDTLGTVILVIRVTERPLLTRWTVKGVERLSERSVKERVRLAEGRPIDRAAVQRGVGAIDSLYHAQGYYAARVRVIETAPAPGQVGIVFDVDEGNRVAISQVQVEGNTRYSDKALVKRMSTRPEGFFWWQKGQYDDDKLQQDVRERLPGWYGS
ncbi:MAG: hypothetical protein KA180_00900, partial [Gemmatimonadales bacterium]|nr:hypothetical protein [Gemmatimonadales bacterium]